MAEAPSNETLAAMIQNLTSVVESGFSELKEQVATNTKFRLIATGILIMTDAVLLPITLYVIFKFIDKTLA